VGRIPIDRDPRLILQAKETIRTREGKKRCPLEIQSGCSIFPAGPTTVRAFLVRAPDSDYDILRPKRIDVLELPKKK
jgi:hypothetical protein